MGSLKSHLSSPALLAQAECQQHQVRTSHPLQTQLSWLMAVVRQLADCVIALRTGVCLLHNPSLLYFPQFYKIKLLHSVS